MSGKVKVRRNVPDWIKNILKDLEDKKYFFWDEKTGEIVFYHGFCGGKLISPLDVDIEGYRVCTKCEKKFSPNDRAAVPSPFLLAVVFKEGVGEEDAKKVLSAFVVEPVETRKDKKNENINAVIIKDNRQENSSARNQLIEKLESHPKVRAVLSVPISSS